MMMLISFVPFIIGVGTETAMILISLYLLMENKRNIKKKRKQVIIVEENINKFIDA